MEEEEEVQRNYIPKRRAMPMGYEIASAEQPLDDDKHDLISKLPDCLLLEILSRLEFVQVIKTSLLSKRWRYLWRSTLILDFDFLRRRCKFDRIGFIDKCLSNHEKTKVRKLSIPIMYDDKHSLTVDSWIRFAVNSNVEELKLDLLVLDGEFSEDNWLDSSTYKLHGTLFKCRSLTKLTLVYCDLQFPSTIRLTSLTTLKLSEVNLPFDGIEHLTSGCPLLEDLVLVNCNSYDDLNIRIKNNQVKNLLIEENFHSENFGITIDAPNVLSLKLSDIFQRQYHVKNLQSVTSADFGTVGEYYEYGFPFENLYTNRNVAVAEVLHSLRHVKKLKLSSSCIRVLSVRKIQGFGPLPVHATDIELRTGFTTWELPGIVYLLQSASSLENLTILIERFYDTKVDDEFVEESSFYEKRYWKLQEPSFYSSVLKNAKTININGFHRSSSGSSCRFTPNKYGLDTCMGNETEFVKFSLKNAEALERMVLITDKFGLDQITTDKLMKEVAQKLSSYPKASSAAELLVT